MKIKNKKTEQLDAAVTNFPEGLPEEASQETQEQSEDVSEATLETPEESQAQPENLAGHKKPFVIKREQQRNLIIVFVVVIAIFYFLYHIIAGNAESTQALHAKAAQKQEKIELADPMEQADAKSVWIERIQNRLQSAEKENQQLTKQVNELTTWQQQFENQEKAHQQEYQDIKDHLSEYLQKQPEGKDGQSQQPATSSDNNMGGLFPASGAAVAGSVGGSQQPPEVIPEPQIRVDKLNLVGGSGSSATLHSGESQEKLKTALNYVPSGTFVKGIMLGGADVAAGAMSQSDPSPMLFRILESGTLPNHQRSSLKNCVVTAAVVGDISSETGKIRLERMSCTRPNGKILDLAVEGTVFGPTGKNGIRGRPVWREGSLLQRAFIAGALSGLSGGLAQKYTTTSISPLGSTQSVNNSDIFQYGAAQGIGKAMDRLAEYNIKRAEQYHPVIQLGAGTVVDIVFLKGFFLGDEEESGQDLIAGEKAPPYKSTAQTSQSFPQENLPANNDDASYQAAQNSLKGMKGNV